MLPSIILLIGLPGSGKSTYAARQGWPVLSSDETRRLLLDEVRDQSANRRIFALLRSLLRTRLELARPVTCVDATNLTPHERRPYVKTAQLYGARIEAVFFETPLDLCRQRNRNRGREVPDDVLDRFAAKMQRPTLEEGFTRVTVIRPDGSTTVVPSATPDPG